MTASLWPSFCTVRVKISRTARDAAMGGDKRTSFWSGSSMFSKLDCESSGEVYELIIAELKFDESRYCSTRAVSSASLDAC